jgi:hypothetical protein
MRKTARAFLPSARPRGVFGIPTAAGAGHPCVPPVREGFPGSRG